MATTTTTNNTARTRASAGKKAAATRKRNEVRNRSAQGGNKAASTRQKNEARSALDQAFELLPGPAVTLDIAAERMARVFGLAYISVGKRVEPDMDASGLRISCATSAASKPSADNFSLCRRCSSMSTTRS